MSVRTMSMRDHLEIETEGSMSPLQVEISRLSRDAEARKARLENSLAYYIARRTLILAEVDRIDHAMRECRDEIASLS